MIERRRILVVDDDPTVRESVRRILEERGYEVECVETGRDGLERVRTGYFDCALFDLKMPDMDGMDIVRVAREHRDNMAVLIMTGYASVDTAAEATRLGVSDYICKPFTPEEITQAVERALQSLPRVGPALQADRIVRELRGLAPRPEDREDRSPQTVAQMVAKSIGVKKAGISALNALVLGVLAGVYIGFGAQLATLVTHDAPKVVGLGLAQVVAGGVFSVGLMLVVIAGGELFTGNILMIASVLGREYGIGRMLSRWAIVYVANFIGSALLAGIMYYSGLWKMGNGAVGARAIAIANAKVSLPWAQAFVSGIGCNWLVCLAVWMALSAREIQGKILAIFFPIMAFVAIGYEHCVANMYFVPMGIFLKGSTAAAGMDLAKLTWGRFIAANLVPVTIGNIVGGAIFVGTLYWFVYVREEAKKARTAPVAR